MDLDQLDLNPRITAAVKKAKLKSLKEVLHFSGPDLQRLTGLSGPDVQHLLRTVSSHLRGSSIFTGGQTALDLRLQKERFPEQHQRLSLGCPVLDGLLRGGLPLDGITELAGRSSAGKTQLALQLCLAVQLPRQHGGLEAGAVYVCTEDAFPNRRLQQLIAQQQRLRTDAPVDTIRRIKFGDHIFIEHVADVDALLECVSKKVPMLLSRGMARLLVIDSVAAPFRWRSSATDPHLTFQVTEAMQDTAPGLPRAPEERLAPALGITWSNQLFMRLMADRHRPEEDPLGRHTRTLRVVFAPHLPPSSCSYTVNAEGVRGTPGTQPC
ncbi:DNA repair protein XRCC3 [Molossus nigricans]